MHAVTGISGSAPAYLYAFTEALEAAGHAAGLPLETAQRLARATMASAGQLTIKVNGSVLSVVTCTRNRWPSAATSNGLKPIVSLGKAKSSRGRDGSKEPDPSFIATAIIFESGER